jgi:hypothetical protein
VLASVDPIEHDIAFPFDLADRPDELAARELAKPPLAASAPRL